MILYSLFAFITLVRMMPSTNAAANCEVDTLCLDKTEGYRVEDPYNCKQYYFCLHDPESNDLKPSDTPISCGSGEYFEEDLQDCSVDSPSSPCMHNCGPTCAQECQEDFTYRPDPNNCKNYYVCLAGGEEFLSCPDSTPYFDGATCVADASACCDICVPYCSEDTLFQEVMHPFDCRSYYICLEEVGVPRINATCGSGEIFDSSLHGCVEGTTCEPYCDSVTEGTTSGFPIGTTTERSQSTAIATETSTTPPYTTTREESTTVKPQSSEAPSTIPPTTTEESTTVRPQSSEAPSTIPPTTTQESTTVRPQSSEAPSTIPPTTIEESTTVRPQSTESTSSSSSSARP